MRVLHRFRWVILSVVVLLAALIGVFLLRAPKPVWDIAETDWVAFTGDTFRIPAAAVRAGHKTVNAVGVLTAPDGTVLSDQTVLLRSFGSYTVTYTATVGRHVYAESRTLTVRGRTAFVSSELSSVTYGTYDGTQTPGLLVHLAQGDTLYVSQALELADVDASESILECFATPMQKGVLDFRKLIFTFTDTENPDIFFRVSAMQSSDGDQYPYTYCLAGANGQPMEGWEESHQKLHINNVWGTPGQHSFSLLFAPGIAEKPADAMPIRIGYDPATRRVYSSGQLVADFDDPSFFYQLWEGLPSGKAFLSVSADLYVSETANFCISKVRGLDLTAEEYVDTDGPDIALDAAFDVMPRGEVGRAYPIPAASARDTYTGSADVAVTVQQTDGAADGRTLAITVNTFTPDVAGTYCITYTAADAVGNVSQLTRTVEAVDELPPPELTFADAMPSSVTVGTVLSPAMYQADTHDSFTTVTVSATLNGKPCKIGDGLRLTETGLFELTYTATDYIGLQSVTRFAVDVLVNDAPFFPNEPSLPLFLLSGCSYELPECEAYDYRSGSEERKPASLTVTLNGETTALSAGASWTPTVEEDGLLATICYTCEGVSLTREVPVVLGAYQDGGRDRLPLKNYIRGTNLTVTGSASYLTLTADAPDSRWVFANQLLAEGTGLTFSISPETANFESLSVLLINAADTTHPVAASFRQSNGQLLLSCGGETVVIADSFDAETTLTLICEGNWRLLVNGRSFELTACTDGTPFDGFGEWLYLSMVWEQAAPGSQARLYAVDNQPMGNLAFDRIPPRVVLPGGVTGLVALGETVTLPAALVGDVLDANVVCTMSVCDQNGDFVTAVDGTLLKDADPTRSYELVLSLPGAYQVTYKSTEANRQSPNFGVQTQILQVEDLSAPVITLHHSFPTAVAVGSCIILPDVTVTDDQTATEDIRLFRYVVTPDGQLVELPSDSNAVVAEQPGVYEIRLVAYDAFGNINLVRHPVTVEP